MKKKAKQGKGKGAEVFQFPKREMTEPLVGRPGVENALKKGGIDIQPGLLIQLRIPHRMVRGVNEELEFFDVWSKSPFPYKREHSPSYCKSQKKAVPPGWVNEYYLSVTKEKGKKFLTLVDVSRMIFIKMDLADQDAITAAIYDKVLRGTGVW